MFNYLEETFNNCVLQFCRISVYATFNLYKEEDDQDYLTPPSSSSVIYKNKVAELIGSSFVLNIKMQWAITAIYTKWESQRNWVFVINYDLQIPLSLKPHAIVLRYFKLWILLDEKSLKYQRFTPSGGKI